MLFEITSALRGLFGNESGTSSTKSSNSKVGAVFARILSGTMGSVTSRDQEQHESESPIASRAQSGSHEAMLANSFVVEADAAAIPFDSMNSDSLETELLESKTDQAPESELFSPGSLTFGVVPSRILDNDTIGSNLVSPASVQSSAGRQDAPDHRTESIPVEPESALTNTDSGKGTGTDSGKGTGTDSGKGKGTDTRTRTDTRTGTDTDARKFTSRTSVLQKSSGRLSGAQAVSVGNQNNALGMQSRAFHSQKQSYVAGSVQGSAAPEVFSSDEHAVIQPSDSLADARFQPDGKIDRATAPHRSSALPLAEANTQSGSTIHTPIGDATAVPSRTWTSRMAEHQTDSKPQQSQEAKQSPLDGTADSGSTPTPILTDLSSSIRRAGRIVSNEPIQKDVEQHGTARAPGLAKSTNVRDGLGLAADRSAKLTSATRPVATVIEATSANRTFATATTAPHASVHPSETSQRPKADQLQQQPTPSDSTALRHKSGPLTSANRGELVRSRVLLDGDTTGKSSVDPSELNSNTHRTRPLVPKAPLGRTVDRTPVFESVDALPPTASNRNDATVRILGVGAESKVSSSDNTGNVVTLANAFRAVTTSEFLLSREGPVTQVVESAEPARHPAGHADAPARDLNKQAILAATSAPKTVEDGKIANPKDFTNTRAQVSATVAVRDADASPTHQVADLVDSFPRSANSRDFFDVQETEATVTNDQREVAPKAERPTTSGEHTKTVEGQSSDSVHPNSSDVSPSTERNNVSSVGITTDNREGDHSVSRMSSERTAEEQSQADSSIERTAEEHALADSSIERAGRADISGENEAAAAQVRTDTETLPLRAQNKTARTEKDPVRATVSAPLPSAVDNIIETPTSRLPLDTTITNSEVIDRESDAQEQPQTGLQNSSDTSNAQQRTQRPDASAPWQFDKTKSAAMQDPIVNSATIELNDDTELDAPPIVEPKDAINSSPERANVTAQQLAAIDPRGPQFNRVRRAGKEPNVDGLADSIRNTQSAQQQQVETQAPKGEANSNTSSGQGEFPTPAMVNNTIANDFSSALLQDLSQLLDEAFASLDQGNRHGRTVLSGTTSTAQPSHQTGGSWQTTSSFLLRTRSALASQAVAAGSTDESWRSVQMKLDDGDGFVTIRTRKEDGKTKLTLEFSDSTIRAAVEGQADRLRESLEMRYNTAVDLSFGADQQNSQHFEGQSSSSNRIDTITSVEGEPVADEDAANTKQPRILAGSTAAWIG